MKDIQVLEPKSIEAIIGSTVLTISGSNVSISCGVRGFPTPSIEWTKDGVLLGAERSVLSLSSVDSDDTGLYTCTATSPLGSFDSQSANLTVIGRCFIHFAERLLEDVKKHSSVVRFSQFKVIFYRSLWYYSCFANGN